MDGCRTCAVARDSWATTPGIPRYWHLEGGTAIVSRDGRHRVSAYEALAGRFLPEHRSRSECSKSTG